MFIVIYGKKGYNFILHSFKAMLFDTVYTNRWGTYDEASLYKTSIDLRNILCENLSSNEMLSFRVLGHLNLNI